MFWRFGFHNASAIDSLLDKEDVQLEAILDQDDLLQECKAQNTRLLDYFQRVDVLQKLFAYATGSIEGDEKGRFKYPYVAAEVLCSEIWSIVETCLNEQAQLLVPFWETVLDRSPEEMKTEMVMASHFSKINAVFLTKKPPEMFAFIRSQPSVVERLLLHIETPSFVDLIVRIIQLDEQPSGVGVLEWLSSENLMGRLIELLSPSHTPDIHSVVADLIKGIISMAAPSPGAGLTEGLQNGPASNKFARELASKENIGRLTSYLFVDFEPPPIADESGDEKEDDRGSEPPPNFESKVSSVIQSISVIVELIRKNNSDFFEPYLFHTLRNRLIQVQQQSHEDDRDALEQSMKEMVDRMGVVHLGPILEVLMPRLDQLRLYLMHPRSLNGSIKTTVGSITPLTFERYRITELFAELLHCSNMSLLSRSPDMNRMYDTEGRLEGGLAALEELARVIEMNNGSGQESMNEGGDGVEPARELPVTGHDMLSIDSDDDMSDDEPGSSDDDAMEEIVMDDDSSTELHSTPTPELSGLPLPSVSSSPPTLDTISSSPLDATSNKLPNPDPRHAPNSSPRSVPSRRSSRRANTYDFTTGDKPLPVGEQLKKQFLEVGILSTLMDLFFEFPWNNFLHGVVYDIVHQILTSPVDAGFNRELAISLFRDVRLMQRIVDGQKRNDEEAAKSRGARLGYMGYLTLLAEDVIMVLNRFPPDLRLTLIEYAPTPGWDEYVMGRYLETKRKDTRLLGGGKPTVSSATTRNVKRWKVDENDIGGTPVERAGAGMTTEDNTDRGNEGMLSKPTGEFRRVGSMSAVRTSTADFGPAAMTEEEPEEESRSAPHFARYLEQEMHAADNASDDEDDEEGGWLSQSTFSLTQPPVTARHRQSASAERRPLSLTTSGFEDAFDPSATRTMNISKEGPFTSHSDDAYGPFSDVTAATSSSSAGGEPFTFSSTFSDESFDSESFGDFGDFQSANTEGDGELTPTTGSWTFASDSGAEEDGAERGMSQSASNMSKNMS